MEFPASFLDKIFARQPPAHGCINALWQTRRSHSTQPTIAQAFARRNALCNCSQCAVAPLRRFPARPGICKGFGMALRRWSRCLFSGAGCAGKSQYRQNPIPVKPHLDKRRTQQNAGYQKTPRLRRRGKSLCSSKQCPVTHHRASRVIRPTRLTGMGTDTRRCLTRLTSRVTPRRKPMHTNSRHRVKTR